MQAAALAARRLRSVTPGMALSLSAVPAGRLLHPLAADQPVGGAAPSLVASANAREPGAGGWPRLPSAAGRAPPGRADSRPAPGRPGVSRETRVRTSRQHHEHFSRSRSARDGRRMGRRTGPGRRRRRVPDARGGGAPPRVPRLGGAPPGRVAAVMADPSPFERTVRPADGSPPFFQDYCNWDRIEGFRRFVFESPAGAIAAALMRSAHAPLLSRARPRQGTGHDGGDPLAPRPALLLHGGGQDREPLDRPRPGRA